MRAFNELSQEEQIIHEQWMTLALNEAQKAAKIGEVPIGAVIVQRDRLIASAYNLREVNRIATAHAELLAIEKANQAMDAWRVEDARLYVTLEPCPMCAGAIINARIPQIIFGAKDPKAGCAGSLYNLLEDGKFNHTVDVISGVLEEECGMILSRFFKELRNNKKKLSTENSNCAQ